MSKVRGKFFEYVLPAIFSFALSGVYTIVDGYFIGNRMGDMGIAAITLGYPVTALVQAAGTGLGLGAAICYTILKSRSEDRQAEYMLGTASLMMLVLSFVMTGAVLSWLYPILRLLGAEGAITEPTAEYVRYIVLGTVFQVMGTGLVPFIRNMGGAKFAMAAMFCGFFGNILFDWLFVWVWPYGLAGAAWASVLGQAIAMFMALGYFASKKTRISLPPFKKLPEIAGKIIRVGAAPFGLVLCPNITLLIMNRFFLVHGGEQALAGYGVIGYIVYIVLLLLQGVGDGCQPLISRFYGGKDKNAMLHTRRLSYITSFAITLVSILICILYRKQAGLLFGASDETNLQVARILPWFMAALIFEAYTRMGSAYLYATEKSSLSYLLVYAEPVLVLAFLLALAPGLGLTGVWIANPAARAAAAAAAAVIKRRDDRQRLAA